MFKNDEIIKCKSNVHKSCRAKTNFILLLKII